MIEVTSLSKFYGSHEAVKNVSFSIKKGEVVGFLGPNGAGKSTIMNILTGYLSLSDGKVLIDGIDILENPEAAKKRIGYLPEMPPLYVDMTVSEYLFFIYDLKKVKFPKNPHICEIMSLVGIEDVANRLIKNLSKGYRQRVGLAGALVGNPDVLILDEPTVGLDPKQIIEIRNLISRLGENHTVILSSHILSEIQAVCERVLIINKGEIVADDTLDNLYQQYNKEAELLLTVKGDGQKIFSALEPLDEIDEILVSFTEQDEICDFVITPQENLDIRELVSLTVAKNGGTMLSFMQNSMSLEQIFLSLTEEAISNEEYIDDFATDEDSEQIEEVCEITEESEKEESGDEGSL